MRTPTKTTAIVLTGAVALASGAYALGSQAGDGAATAHDGERSAFGRGDGEGRGFRGPGPRLEGLAQRLGVTTERLRAALEDLRGERPGREEMEQHRAAHAAALARELNIDAAKVRAALDRLHDDRPMRRDGPRRGMRRHVGPGREARAEHLAALARELDVSRADLRAALRRLRESERARHEARRNEFAAALAERLNLPVERVREALPAFGPHHGRRGP